MHIAQLAKSLNEAASEFEIGRLQDLRVRLHTLSRAPCNGIFNVQTTHEDYAFHVGGRTELQFNIGREKLNEAMVIRHGVAFSLQLSQTLPTIKPLRLKISRFNDFIRQFPEYFLGLNMWHYDSSGRSENYPVSAINENLIEPDNFIMLGRWVPENKISVRDILTDFDRLLPLYVYVETQGEQSALLFDSTFAPGCSDLKVNTTATVTGGTVDINLRHKVLQRSLYDHLCREAGMHNVRIEHQLDYGLRVDAAVRGNRGFTFYEVKVAPTVQSCVRTALGQLLEYAYWPSSNRAHELVIVGEPNVYGVACAYLHFLRERFRFPIWYRCIDIERGLLGPKS